MTHIPVLLEEVIEYLDPKPNKNYIDATLGQAGHAKEILKKNGPNGKVLGIDLDISKVEKQDRLIIVNDSYINLKRIAGENNFQPDGILFDLGMSSSQVDSSGRGFTFLKDEPLDMRFNPETNDLTAESIVNQYSQKEIETILTEYGEEKYAKKISKAIVKQREIRPIKTTFQLVKIIEKVVPKKYSKIHCATRTFQALRIAVNDELNNIRKVLKSSSEILAPNGRIVVISFHSLEDKIIKEFFKKSDLEILTKKPITPSQEEVKSNRRSRSAKLRAAIKK